MPEPVRGPERAEPELRRAMPEDAPRVAALVDAAYRHYTPLLGRTPMPMLTDFAAATGDHPVWLLDDGSRILGVIELMARPDHLWIDNVAIDPSAQGRGLGRRLLAFAEDEARRFGLPAMGLLTNERYVTNIAMYERYGYRETHREPHLGTDLIHFRKALPAEPTASPEPAASLEPAAGPEPRIRLLSTDALTPGEVTAIRTLMDAAFGDEEDERFTDEDWDHALGGVHVVLDLDGAIVAHASVVEREIHADGHVLRAGYVEAVATRPDRQGTGLGTQVMEAVDGIIDERNEIGVLGTGSHRFYERLGWRTWLGPASVRATDGDRRTPDEDGYIMIRTTARTPPLDLGGTITCDWRPGDVW